MLNPHLTWKRTPPRGVRAVEQSAPGTQPYN
jgi:hypothetical protein